MRYLRNILIGWALAALVFSIGCCCTGGLDNTDIPLNVHHEGGGGTT